MVKGSKRFNEINPIVILNIDIYCGEIFKPITSNIVPGVYNYLPNK